MKGLAFPLCLDIGAPSHSDKRADAERLKMALLEEGYPNVEIPLGILRDLPGLLRKRDFEIVPVIGFTGDRYRIVSLHHERTFGVAIDIGTTNIALSLLDMASGEKVGSGDLENPQIAFGEDVLARLHKSMTGEDLRKPLIDGLNSAVVELCDVNDISRDEIVAAVVAGNTIMTHFFLGLPVENIPVAPYVPAVHEPGFFSAVEIGLEIHRNGVVFVFPNAGSYVGGDIISGVLSTGMHCEGSPCLFVDVGTNAEIVLGCRDWLLAAAGAAGPALEGGISAIGRRAAEGAIYRVGIDGKTMTVIPDTVGGGEPSGVCGSGMIDLISEMFDAGIIDRRGRFLSSSGEFVISDAGGKRLVIKEIEIENFLRSKAAMFTSLSVLAKSVGLNFADIGKFFVAGALGSGIDPEKAINIGLLPDVGRERFLTVGNASLKGAEMFLLDRELIKDVRRISSLVTYMELNEDGEFMREFPGAFFIPGVGGGARDNRGAE